MTEFIVEVSTCDDGSDYTLIMIEKEAMKQDVTANNMLKALNIEGRVRRVELVKK